MTDSLRFVGSARRAALGSQLAISVNGTSLSVPLATYGAGDVVGVDPGEIVRRVPDAGAINHPPNMFPFVELRHPDYPWRVSPGGGRLSPWLVLVVFDAAAVQVAHVQGAPLPVISVDSSALPRLDEAYAWAHAQIGGDASLTIEAIVDQHPELCLSRLVAPHQLAPRSRYVACIVPAFEAGRLAGLGKPVPDPAASTPAWTTGPVELPVYDSWTFTTADVGDFETLARRLKPVDLTGRARPWQIDVGAVADAGTTVAMPSALRPVGTTDSWTGATRDTARTTLEGWLAKEAAMSGPVVGPPLYGGLAAAATKPVPGWLAQLDCDPRMRAVAALGAAVVRDDQEAVVAQAWDQIGHLRRVNRERDGAALSDLVVPRLAVRHLAPAGDAALAIARPAWRRIRAGNTPVASAVAASTVPDALVSARFRRIASVRLRGAAKALAGAVAVANQRTPTLGVLPPNPPQLLTPQTLTRAQPTHSILAAAVSPVIDAGVAVLAARKLTEVRVARPKPLAIGDIATTLVASLSTSTAPQRFRARFDPGDLAHEPTTTAPLVNEIDLPYALLGPLAARDRRYIVGGVDVPLDTVGLLELDPQFIEAALIGASHELVRELQWRGAPVDRRVTPFKEFFDARGTDAGGDIAPVATWPLTDDLGAHVRDRDAAVIVVRGELVRRFPDALIYLARAARPSGRREPSTEVRLPRFRGALSTDTVIVGVDLTANALRGPDGLGWYIVIAEQAGAPKFGLDEPSAEPFETWDDVSWANVTVNAGYIGVAASRPQPASPGSWKWGQDGAHMAAITFQHPVSISIHCAMLLPARNS